MEASTKNVLVSSGQSGDPRNPAQCLILETLLGCFPVVEPM